ncbi:anti-sigma factor [Streptomyces sp. HNM0645]|uniref:anti-sigma factor n=1 Tax=Streptomyces sp. HNM0645 TaxID=2782343 RepID=UPI0024B71DDE|nr:anti-sigma factor [Streptomyces sp. HNM0645]MDI9884278.1 anti-sigma factor [Streptomyces sp. HNM0645]
MIRRAGGAGLHTATGAYALHALPENERESFERHLMDCGACAQEVRELQATAVRLGLAAAVRPAPEVRARVVEQIRHVRQEPPAVLRYRTHRLRRLPRFALAAAVAVGIAGGAALWQHHEAGNARARAERAEAEAAGVSRVLTASDATYTSGRAKNGARVTFVVSRERDRAVMLASDLPALPEGKVYQLWFDDAGTMRDAGLLGGDTGTQTVLVHGPVHDASGMGITVEPSGGSSSPTSPPLMVVALPA